MPVKKTEPEPILAAEPANVVVEVPPRSPWGIAAGLAAAALVGALAFGGGVLLGTNLDGHRGPGGITIMTPQGGFGDGGQLVPGQRP